MEHASQHTTDTAPRTRWATVGWLVCSAVLVGVVVGTWLRMDTERAGAGFATAVAAGDRPQAPALPTAGIDDDGAPGLPAWYRAGDGGQLAAGDGEVLVVNWWASWCGPCEEEAPALREIADDYDGRVTVVGLNAGAEDLESDARAFVRRHELTFPVVRGTRADKDAWGVGGFPETFVVGTDGRVSAHVNGPIDADDLRTILDDELDEERGT